jgi:SAM-dependent methyltransferase
MSTRQKLKRLVPDFLHPFLKPVVRPFLQPERPRVPHTKFPLHAAKRDAVAESLKMSESSVIATSQISERNDFPEVDELIGYWGIVRSVTQLLEPYNPLDKYFDWNNFREKKTQGLLHIQKDLFAIWVAVNKRPKLILEIGCRTGKSIATQLFAHPDPDKCTVLQIDPFIEMGSPELVSRNLEHLCIPTRNIHTFVGYSENVFPAINKTFPELRFDYLLVDGSHRKEDALKDLQMVAPYVSRGGYLVFDDIGSYGPGVGYGLIDVWNIWKEKHEGEFRFHEYPMPWGFAAARKK